MCSVIIRTSQDISNGFCLAPFAEESRGKNNDFDNTGHVSLTILTIHLFSRIWCERIIVAGSALNSRGQSSSLTTPSGSGARTVTWRESRGAAVAVDGALRSCHAGSYPFGSEGHGINRNHRQKIWESESDEPMVSISPLLGTKDLGGPCALPGCQVARVHH